MGPAQEPVVTIVSVALMAAQILLDPRRVTTVDGLHHRGGLDHSPFLAGYVIVYYAAREAKACLAH